jgi:hypothetical protein
MRLGGTRILCVRPLQSGANDQLFLALTGLTRRPLRSMRVRLGGLVILARIGLPRSALNTKAEK